MGFMRNNAFAIGLAATIAGVILLLLGIWTIWIYKLLPNFLPKFTVLFRDPYTWNVVCFIAGILLVFTAGWEVLDLFSAKKKLYALLDTKKKSELIANKDDIKELVKRLPKKYEALVNQKEGELGIK